MPKNDDIEPRDEGNGTILPVPKPCTYKVVYADPPWDLFQQGKLGASEHYPLMNLEAIKGLGAAVSEVAAESSFCFLWVTAAMLPHGPDVLNAWGFKYTNFYFWAKPRFTLGNTVRNAGELCLIGVRGKGTKVAYRSQPNWGLHGLQAHSRKPEEVVMTIERLVGADEETRMLELFARRPSPSRLNWDIWGNEIPANEPSLISLAPWGYPIPADFDPNYDGNLQR